MPSHRRPDAAWYDKLSLEEAREVHDLEQIIDNIKLALTTASERRILIQRRASARVTHGQVGEQRATRKRLARRIESLNQNATG